VRCGTYNERDDSVHCGVLPISAANEGYERSQDTKSVQCATLDDNKYNSPIQLRISAALRSPGEVDPCRDSSYYVGLKVRHNRGQKDEMKGSPEQMTLEDIVMEK